MKYFIAALLLLGASCRTPIEPTAPAAIEPTSKKIFVPNNGVQTFRGSEAVRFAEERNMCREPLSRVVCPEETTQQLVIRIESESFFECGVTCQISDSVQHGPFEYYEGSRRRGRFSRGTLIRDQYHGTWTEGVVTCTDSQCREQPTSEVGYHATYGYDGVTRRWTESGVVIREQMFDKGIAVGVARTWYDDGKLWNETTYENGEVAEVATWHPTGAVASRAKFVNGVQDGPWRQYDADGNIIEEGEYKLGAKIGTWVTRSGPQLTSQEAYDEHGTPDGEFCYWTDSGTLLGCFTIRNGSGVFYQYSDTGHIVVETPLRHGLKHGVEIIRDDQGRVVSRATYRDDRPHGVSREWYENELRTELNYHEGKLHGRAFRSWNDNTPIRATGNYCIGNQCGTWRIESDAEVTIEEWTDSGVLYHKKTMSLTGAVVSEWPTAESEDPYDRCIYQLRTRGCCEETNEAPTSVKICGSGSR